MVGVGTMLYINIPEAVQKLCIVKENGLQCSCGKNDAYKIMTVANRDMGLVDDEYVMPDCDSNKETIVCGESLDDEISRQLVKVLSDEEAEYRLSLLEQGF